MHEADGEIAALECKYYNQQGSDFDVVYPNEKSKHTVALCDCFSNVNWMVTHTNKSWLDIAPEMNLEFLSL